MSPKFGMRNFGAESEVFLGRDYQAHATYSDKYASEIDDEIQSILKENYDRAKQVLKDNIDKLHTMAKILLEKETIYTEQVEAIMNGASVEDVVNAMNEKERITKEKEEEERKKQAEELERSLQELTLRAQQALNGGVLPQQLQDANIPEQNVEKANVEQVASEEKKEETKQSVWQEQPKDEGDK